MMEFLREMEMIKQMEMMRELHHVEAGRRHRRKPAKPQKPSAGEKEGDPASEAVEQSSDRTWACGVLFCRAGLEPNRAPATDAWRKANRNPANAGRKCRRQEKQEMRERFQRWKNLDPKEKADLQRKV